jgi:hypothetical protein
MLYSLTLTPSIGPKSRRKGESEIILMQMIYLDLMHLWTFIRDFVGGKFPHPLHLFRPNQAIIQVLFLERLKIKIIFFVDNLNIVFTTYLASKIFANL